MSKGVLLSQRGSTLLMALGFAGLAAITTLGVLELSRMMLVDRRTEISQLEARYANEKALTMAGYLITNNLIICRTEGIGGNKAKRCEWGGGYHRPTPIGAGEFKISGLQHTAEGILTSKIWIGVANGRGRETEMRFQLANWSTDERARELIGKIPNEAALVDDDWWIVIVEAISTYRDGNGEERELRTVGGIRRPLASPILDLVDSPVCHFSCKTGWTNAPNPDCKSRQTVLPMDENIEMRVKLTNLGPGALIGTTYQKIVTYDPTFYPSITAPETSAFDLFKQQKDGGVAVLMPLQSLEGLDKFKCTTPEIFQNNSATTDNQQFMNLFRYRYDISIARFDPNDPNYRQSPTRFLAQYDPFEPKTYKPNPTLSRLEPKKAGGSLAPVDSNLARLPAIRPPPPPTTTTTTSGFEGRSDGDGGGGNN